MKLEYHGPFGNVEVEYIINFDLPCIFNQNAPYLYWIDYYTADGNWIDSYAAQFPGNSAGSVFHLAETFPCTTIESLNN